METYHELTAVELKALRTCDEVYCHYTTRGESHLVACKRARHDDPWREDKRVEIRCDYSFQHYSLRSPEGRITAKAGDILTACSSIDDEARKLIAKLARAGDALILHWTSDNNNQYIDEARRNGARLHCDSLRVEICRRPKNSTLWDSAYTILANVSVCEDNSARMVRGIAYTYPELSAAV